MDALFSFEFNIFLPNVVHIYKIFTNPFCEATSSCILLFRVLVNPRNVPTNRKRVLHSAVDDQLILTNSEVLGVKLLSAYSFNVIIKVELEKNNLLGDQHLY